MSQILDTISDWLLITIEKIYASDILIDLANIKIICLIIFKIYFYGDCSVSCTAISQVFISKFKGKEVFYLVV